MTQLHLNAHVDPAATGWGLAVRLRPLFVASFLQSVGFWIPIEKLFMNEIGFGPGTVAVMAASYAAVVPLLEVPSGVLADRWSRRGMLVIANLALAVSAVVGGLSTNVPTYIVSAMILGVFFAMQSGTVDSIVYDTTLEETGDAGSFERRIGRLRFVESAGLVASAFVGGLLAEVLPLRATYFLTVPFVVAAIASLAALHEPQLHRVEESTPFRQQLAATYKTLLQRGTLRHVIVVGVVTAVLMQALLEFGPLWMVALSAPTSLYGPQWAGLTSALGLGGVLGARLDLGRPVYVGVITSIMATACVALTVASLAGIVVVAQIVLMLLAVAIGVRMSGRLHDSVPSSLRAGVASGVGTLTWLTFLPFALVFGAVSDRSGVRSAGWTLTVLTAAASLMLVLLLRRPPSRLVPELPPSFTPDRFLPADDPDWHGHWVVPPTDWADEAATDIESTAMLARVRDAIGELPSPYRDVIIHRDVEGLPVADVGEVVGRDSAAVRELLNEARGQVRAQLERYFDEETT